MINHSRGTLVIGNQPGKCLGKSAVTTGRIVRGLLIATSLVLTPPAGAEPVKFDWRFIAHEDASLPSEAAAEPQLDTGPNPVVLPIPEPAEAEDSEGGWRWLRPRIANSPGPESDRTAIQLAEEAQQADMARQNSPLNGVLPGSLSGLAPMAVESGVEWRF